MYVYEYAYMYMEHVDDTHNTNTQRQPVLFFSDYYYMIAHLNCGHYLGEFNNLIYSVKLERKVSQNCVKSFVILVTFL